MSTPAIGPYEIVRELGRGGMGIVFEARHADFPGRRFALKVIKSTDVGADVLERFGREAQLLAKVRHPNVLSVHALGRTEEGLPYLVTDLVEGSNLRSVARGETVAPERAATIVRALAGAVAAIHAQGILHRDLKPENVILRTGDDPVLLDFGLARGGDARSLTRTGDLLGTPAYMSPEQAGGEKGLDARTDVYGLGAILFELLAGRAPFEGAAIQIVTAVLEKTPRWPSSDREVPEALEAVLRRAMSKDRDARPPSAEALGEELGRFLRGESASSRGARGPLAIGLALVAAIAAVAVIATRSPPAPESAPAKIEESNKPIDDPRPPPFSKKAPIITYRGLVDWLETHASHPEAKKIQVEIAAARSNDQPLLRVTCSAGNVLRFVSPSRLVIGGATSALLAFDLESGLNPEPVWVPGMTDEPVGGVAVGRRRPDGSVPILVSIGADVGRILSKGKGPLSLRDRPPALRTRAKDPRLDETPAPAHMAIALSPDERLAVSGGDWKHVRVFAPEEASTAGDLLLEHSVCVEAAAFSRDGRVLLTGTKTAGADNAIVTAWDLSPPGKRLGSRKIAGDVMGISAAPDGSFVVSGAGCFIFAAPDGEPGELKWERLPDLPGEHCPGVIFNPRPGPTKFRAYAATNSEPGVGTVTLYGLRHDAGPATVLHRTQGNARSIDVSPDGELIAISLLRPRGRLIEIWPTGDP